MNAPHAAVWAALSDLGSHDTWMRDAKSIEFHTAQTAGIGTRMDVLTSVGPFRTTDVMEVVGWTEGESIEVVHEGVVTGRGLLSVEPETSTSTLVSWDEILVFPWWLGGGVTAWFARPVLSAIWRGNLKRLEELASSP